MRHIAFRHEIDEDGIRLRLYRQGAFRSYQLIPTDTWADFASREIFGPIAHMLRLLESEQDGVSRSAEEVTISHPAAAGLSEPVAHGLSLPVAVPFMLNIRAENLITDRNFELRLRWIDRISRPLSTSRIGAFLRVGAHTYRIPEPLFSICEAVDSFRKADTSDDPARFAAIAKLQELFPADERDKLTLDPYLRDFRVLHATAFSLSLRTDGTSFQFDPVLFGKDVSSRLGPRSADESNLQEDLVSEAESLLSEHQSQVFARERFPSYDSARDRYVIESGTYVYVDPALRDALSVVRRFQRADNETRKHFVRSPHVHLRAELGSDYDAEIVDHLFIETEQYSERVIDIGIWAPPVLPWIVREPNTWLPERFGVQIGGKFVDVSAEDLPMLRDAVEKAIGSGEEAVEFKGERIPATSSTLDALGNLVGVVKPSLRPDCPAENEHHQINSHKHVLVVSQNFERLDFVRNLVRRAEDGDAEIPAVIKSTPMPHQIAGFTWLRRSWAVGYSGVLLADDMGLGKTFQVLMFLSSVKEERQRGATRRPILIVAPTGLLKNWEDEHDLHLYSPGLGELCRAYGNHLSKLRNERTRDIDTGIPVLDDEALRRSDWVLTTYETLRDYHFSFAKVHFSCAILDEMQKVKNPASLLFTAVTTINTEFMIGLTGTPIENRLEDLWAIIDVLSPGRLGDLKTFSKKYDASDMKSLEALRAALLDESTDGPAPVLRRLKIDHLPGLPEKHIHFRRRKMPPAQATAYAAAVKKAKSEDAGSMLETLHQLRGISLHPVWPNLNAVSEPEAYIAQSARLIETFAILDEIAQRREKALIFLESLDMQDQLALMIKQKYRLSKLPLQINGELSGEKRKKAVDEFQSERSGFGVMILSPKAGGVGLTLTAANHVIHLSRWWNPAVEDQCTDRIYRIGQKQPVHVYYPMAVHPEFGEGSFDDVLNGLLHRKRELGRRMLIPPVNAKDDEAWFTERLSSQTNASVMPIKLEEIDSMEPEQFERWAVARMKATGYVADRTQRSYDHGADGIMVHKDTKCRVIIQCKLRQNREAFCGETPIDDLLRARTAYGSGPVTLVALTNATDFSERAKRRARDVGIVLVARSDLPNWPSGLI